MSDEALAAWIEDCVRAEVGEGHTLDYKATLSASSRAGRHELARDLTAFANELGGTILIGIPERGDGKPGIPSTDYGISPVAGLEERIESALADAVSPRIPQVHIRCVPTVRDPELVVYVVWTPASYAAPHMVVGYDDFRYYRRAQYRNEPMADHLVKASYERSAQARDGVRSFFADPDFVFTERGPLKPWTLRLACVPYMRSPGTLGASKLLSRLDQLWRPPVYDSFVLSHFGAHSQAALEQSSTYCRIYDDGSIVLWETSCTDEGDDEKVLFEFGRAAYLWMSFLQAVVGTYATVPWAGDVSVSFQQTLDGRPIYAPSGWFDRERSEGTPRAGRFISASMERHTSDLDNLFGQSVALLNALGLYFGFSELGSDRLIDAGGGRVQWRNRTGNQELFSRS